MAWDEGEARNMSKVKTYEIATPTYSTYINLSVPVLFEDSLLKASHNHSLRLEESVYDVIFSRAVLLFDWKYFGVEISRRTTCRRHADDLRMT